MKYRATWTATLTGVFDVEADSRLDGFTRAEDVVRQSIRVAPVAGGVVSSYDVQSLDAYGEEPCGCNDDTGHECEGHRA